MAVSDELLKNGKMQSSRHHQRGAEDQNRGSFVWKPGGADKPRHTLTLFYPSDGSSPLTMWSNPRPAVDASQRSGARQRTGE
jgi:hypothetical protein